MRCRRNIIGKEIVIIESNHMTRQEHLKKVVAEFREKFVKEGWWETLCEEDGPRLPSPAEVEAFLLQTLTDISDLSIEAVIVDEYPTHPKVNENTEYGWNACRSEMKSRYDKFMESDSPETL